MRKFSLTSPAFEGECIFEFNEFGRLVKFDLTQADLPDFYIVAMLHNLPHRIDGFDIIKGKTGVVTEVIPSISFDMFWKKYDDKARSSKIKTERVWNKMSASEQVKAYNFVSKYKASLGSGICMKYATTYLCDQLWNN